MLTLLLTHKKNFGPHAARFISLHNDVIKQVRKCTYGATIIRNLLLLPVGIQIVKHVFHSSVQLVFETTPPLPINIQLVTLTITRTTTQFQISQKKIFRRFSSRQMQRI